MSNKAVKFVIEAPKGTHCYIPKNAKESECILGENTKLYLSEIGFNTEINKWIISARYIED